LGIEANIERRSDMNDTAVIILLYKNTDHFFQCLESIINTPNCDFYIVENKSDVDVSDRIKDYVIKGKVKKYALFEKNIANNAPKIFSIEGNVRFKDYKYVVYTDGDVVPDKDWLKECKYALDHDHNLFVIGTGLYMDNLPIKTFPEAISWIPDRVFDRGFYLEGQTGCQLMTFRSQDYQQYIKFLIDKPYKIKGIDFTDWNIHLFAKSIGKRSGRTKVNKAKHLTWDYYQDLNHPYTKERLKMVKPWSSDERCKYTIFPEKENPIVSIACVTYNHVKYIAEAIESFLMQKTNFPFEIIIHDDASTDGTIDVIKSYAEKYPDIIRLIIQEKNQYEQGMKNGFLFGYDPLARSVLPIAKGKYIALCEGDDYWTDPDKLQKQVDFLEKNPDFIMCYHHCQTLCNGVFASYGYGEGSKDFDQKSLIKAPGGIATGTKMFRNIYGEKTKQDFIDFSGDFLLNSYMGTKGKCGFIQGIKPSIYRVHSGGVWSGMNAVAKKLVVKRMYRRMYELYLQRNMIEYAKLIKKYVDYKCTFAIIIPTFQRSDGKTPAYLRRALASLLHQTHTDFKVYLIGDKYENNEEFINIAKGFPGELMYFENLSNAVEREKYANNKEALWCSGGVNATNYGIQKAISENLQYVCLLDHDDYWAPNHLAILNGIIRTNKVDWICTKTSVGNGVFFPKNINSRDRLVNFLPLPCGVIKSSVCYNVSTIPIFPRDVFEETGIAIPADADLWKRSAEYIQKNNLKSFYINEHTCIHDTEGYIRHGGGFIMSNDRIKEGVTVITCTGDRPEAFALLQKWMDNQVYKPQQWIVVDDGKVPISSNGKFIYIRREPTDKDYTHTLCLNLPLALDAVKYDKIIIMEDDDWYHPTYIDYMDKLLNEADLVGLGNLLFYYPAIQSYMEKKVVKQPAFAQTAFRKNMIPILKRICENAPKEFELCGKGLIDVFLWKDSLEYIRKEQSVKLMVDLKTASGRILSKNTIIDNPPESLIKRATKKRGAEFIDRNISVKGSRLVVNCEKYITVGMKGLPGRKGLTTHHNVENKKYKKDENSELLKSILKNDVKYYLDFFS